MYRLSSEVAINLFHCFIDEDSNNEPKYSLLFAFVIFFSLTLYDVVNLLVCTTSKKSFFNNNYVQVIFAREIGYKLYKTYF